ncbi:16S rRNA (cytidine(1402)-2'-O)-methyltransferase [Candidatus Uhrbacteria bacterium]|nr:16S rRNA (cytidine(1402)-2'-O)-methyltransferase [Candidatus Uhrbacteria bacterium]
MPTLFVVGTPIGNLSDISERARVTLASVHTVLCEDTRVTGKLLFSYKIATPMMSYHQHSGQTKTNKVIELLESGHDLALVTDAGTPAISDPGGKLIEELLSHFGEELKIIPIPGASAVITALSIAGVSADEFLFLGFPPHKKGRQTFFDRVASVKSTVVLYESTHRIFKTLDEISTRTPDRHLIVCRELTKLHETTYRGTAQDVTEKLQSTSIKGEFVIVLGTL